MMRRDSKRGRESVDSVDEQGSRESSPEEDRHPDEDPGLDSRTRRRVREAKSKARPGNNRKNFVVER